MKMKVEIYLIKLLLLSQIVNTLVLALILYSGSDYEDSPKVERCLPNWPSYSE